MALPSTGELALTDIQTEFGGSNPIGLSEYYAGGLYVPSGTTGDGGAIPTTGEITIGDFYGSQAGITITVTEGTTTSLNAASNTVPSYGFGLAGEYINTSESGFTPTGTVPLYPQSMGNRTPNTAGFGGIRGLNWSAQKYAQPRFYLVVNGTRAQNSFTSIDIQGYGVVTSAGADGYGTITSGSIVRTFWRWNITPTGWDGTGTSTVLFT